MCKLPPIATLGMCLLLAGCQTPLFSDGLLSTLSPNKTLTTSKEPSNSDRSISATKPRIGGRGWRNASTRNSEKEAQTQVAKLNNVDRLREFLAKGNDAMQKGMFDDARIQYETVLSIEPHHATAHHMLGRINDRAKNFPEAERHYLEALSANREDGYLLSDLGYSYLQQGRLSEARQYLTQAITREPNLAVAKVNLAAVYAYGGDQRGALAWLRQVGNEQQAQETLADITSKPAPWIMNGATEALASGPDKYTMNEDGQVIDSNGQQLTTFAEVQAAMKDIRDGQRRARYAATQRQDYLDQERIKQAMAEQQGYNGRNGTSSNDANLNSQMRDIEQAAGTRGQQNLNSRPIYIGPPGQNNGPVQGNAQTQYAQQGNSNSVQPPDWNPLGQIQQFQPSAPHDPYAHLLNPAGPTGIPQQTPQQGYPNQQVLYGQPYVQGSSVPPQFPGSQPAQTQPPDALTIPQQIPQQQYQGQNYVPSQLNGQQQGQPTGLGQSDRGIPQFPTHQERTAAPARQQPSLLQQLPQQSPVNTVPRDQYGPPIQSYPQSNPAWNGQLGNRQPTQSNSHPNSDDFGQSNLQQNIGVQPGSYAANQPPTLQQPSVGQAGQSVQYLRGNDYSTGQPAVPNQRQFNQVQSATGWNIPQQQPIQQLGFDEQPPMARIDRGQQFQQYSDADRQAMQLGMAAGFGALSPIDTGQGQTSQSSQQSGNGSFRRDVRPYNTPQNNFVPNAGPQQPAAVPPANSGFNYDQSGQSPQSSQQLPARGYPGAVPANSGQLPGQASIQAPTRQIHGQSIADQLGQDPQTAQPWLRMPTSQADVTRPVAFSSSTQPTAQQSPNWQRPDLANQAWNNGVLASPTSQPGFGQPHMTNPYLRQPGTDSGQQTGSQEVQTVSWGNQQPASGTGRN